VRTSSEVQKGSSTRNSNTARAAGRLRRDDVCHRITEDQADQRHHRRYPQRAYQHAAKHALLWRSADDRAIGIAPQIERAQKIEVRGGTAGAAYRGPGFALAPLGIDADQGVARGSLELRGQLAARAEKQRAEARNIVVEPRRRAREVSGLPRRANVGDQRRIRGLGREVAAVPVLECGGDRGQDVFNVGVDHAARQHRADRHDEARREEEEQRQHQGRRAPLLAAAAAPERAAQAAGVVVGARQRRMERRRSAALHRVLALPSASYLPTQALKR
jgi:hypothetical protein